MNRLKILPSFEEKQKKARLPSFLRRTLPKGGEVFKTHHLLQKYRLNTVCDEAKCPNRRECYHKKTATFLALGKACTRSCGFCDIDFSKSPKAPEEDEPLRIALSAKELSLEHVVVTMVARDDLEDKGASHIVRIIEKLREHTHSSIEVLTSDFSGDFTALQKVLKARPEIFNHNIETVRRLSSKVRHKAEYERSLAILQKAKSSAQVELVKSGIMLGLGEREEEVFTTLQDLKKAGCDVVTIGHYLQASKNKLRVKAYIPPETFSRYANFGLSLGLSYVYAGPFIRSSYNASFVKRESQKKSTS